jgi:GNAT superfamily N-acetyltransferase
MEILAPDTALAGEITDLWIDLAESQQAYGSHLLTEGNRTRIRESVVRHIVTDTLLIAREGDDLAGFVMFSVESGSFEQDVRRGVIENLFVAEPFRNESLGGELLAAAEEALADRDVEVVALEAMWTNEDARAFYRDRGYEPHRVELEKSLQSDTPSKDGG